MLTSEQVGFYNEHGYLHIPQLFSPGEIDELSDELDRLVNDWARTDKGWTGRGARRTWTRRPRRSRS